MEGIDLSNYFKCMRLDLWPVAAPQNENGDFSPAHVLLMHQVLISCNQQLKSGSFRQRKQFTILFFRPSPVETPGTLHARLRAPAMVSEPLDQKEFSSDNGRTDFFCGFQLFAGDTVIPVEKLEQRAAVIKVIEKCLHRHTAPSKHQRSAHHLRVLRENIGPMLFDRHSQTLLRLRQCVKA